MRITVSGLPGTGTTSLSQSLVKKYNFEMVSAGEIFRNMARENHLDLIEFGRLAQADPRYDLMIDERQREIAKTHDDIIVEGRLSGWMAPHADLKIWLFAPLSCRVKRILRRDLIQDEERAERLTQERERCEAERYRVYYSIDIHDLSPYHLVLNSEHWDIEGLARIVETAVRHLKTRSLTDLPS